MANSSLKLLQVLLALLSMAALFSLASAHGDSYVHDALQPKNGYEKHPKQGGYDAEHKRQPTKKKQKDDDEHMGGYYKPPKEDDTMYKGPHKDVEERPYPGGSYEEEEDVEDEPHGEHIDDSNKPALFKLPRLISLAVEGVVSCQDCKYVGTKSLTNAKLLAGAKVKLVCQAGPRYKTFFYTTATTDKNGFFFLRVPHFNFNKFTPLDDCAVFLLSSPLKECSNPTNINYGKTGAPLRPIPTFAPSSEAFFSVGPLAFAPKPCIKHPPIYYPPPATPKNPPPYASPAPTTPSPPPAY